MKCSFKKSFILLSTFLTFIVSAVGVTPVYAAPIVVMNTNDSGADSLRQAITNALPGDIITFDATLSGQTIRLGSTLTIDKNLTIDGSSLASQITISGDTDNSGSGDVRIFIVNAGATVLIDSLTITKGLGNTFVPGFEAEGAGIFNAGTLTVTDSTFTQNSVTYTDDHEAGGAISNHGTLTVTNTTFFSNASTFIAGGIYNYIGATATVANSTFVGNSATVSGGGIFNRGTLHLFNSTFSGNSAGTSNDGGGLLNWTEGTLNYANNIIADSTVGGDCFNFFGTISTNTNNLVEDSSCSASLSGDPKLNALANNSGPTQTMSLQAGSPALGAGNATVCSAAPVNNLDQRGQVRPAGDPNCDLGAYESTLDETPPDAPLVTAPVGSVATATPTISGTSEAGTLIDVWYFDDSSNPVQICQDATTNGSGNWSCVSSVTLPERSIQLKVNATDGAGNTSADTMHSFTVDLTPPAAPAVNAPTGSTNDATPTISGTAEAGTLINVWYFDDSDNPIQICTDVSVDGSGNWDCVSSVTLPEREIELKVNATDAAGSTSTDTAHFFTVDLTVPGAPVINAPTGFTDDTTPTISGTAEAGNLVNVWYLDDLSNLVQICTDVLVDGLGDWSCVPSTSLPEREIELKVNATDAAGNTSTDTLHTFVVDATVPTVVSIQRVNENPTSAPSVSFTVTFSEAVTGVDTSAPYSDFTLTTNAVMGASISAVSGSGAIYLVTINTGSGNGTIRLDVVDDDSIKDAANNPLGGTGAGNGDFNTGETYTVNIATFGDVATNYWAWSFIERLSRAGITAGCGNGNYCPEASVTRAEMAVFLLRGIHSSSYTPPAVGGSTGFSDVPTDHWAAAWIKQLAAEGITAGCGNGNYCPQANVTRAEMAVFLLRSKHGSSYSPPAVGGSTGFTDVDPTYWAAAWIKQLVAEGITAGCGSGNYCPESVVTRAQMAVFLVRTFNLP